MNILTQRLPEGIVKNGKFYPVYTDFKNWVMISEILEEEKELTPIVLSKIFVLCYKLLPETAEDAFSGMIDFLSCGKKIKEKKEGSRNGGRIFSFKEDAELIYAAFLSQYGIDLIKESLHWYEFCALFSALSKEHKLFEVMNFRAVRLSDIKDRSLRAYYCKMKKLYSLSDNRSAQEQSADIAKSMEALF